MEKPLNFANSMPENGGGGSQSTVTSARRPTIKLICIENLSLLSCKTYIAGTKAKQDCDVEEELTQFVEVSPDPYSRVALNIATNRQDSISLSLSIDIREAESTSSSANFVTVPKEKDDLVKLRATLGKVIRIGVSHQCTLPEIDLEPSLSASLGFGRNLSDADLVDLDPTWSNDSIGVSEGSCISTELAWPRSSIGGGEGEAFRLFDQPTGKGEYIFFTLNVDCRLSNVVTPIVLRRTGRARVYRPDEILWRISVDRRPLSQDFAIDLTEYVDSSATLYPGLFVVAPEPAKEIPASSPTKSEVSCDGASNGARGHSFDDTDDGYMLNDQPHLSGLGSVSPDITDADQPLLGEWRQVVSEWHTALKTIKAKHNGSVILPVASSEDELVTGLAGPQLRSHLSRPLHQQILRLLWLGVPNLLRTEIWQLLTSVPLHESSLLEAYRISVTKPCIYDDVIQRDLARTFPLHDFFTKESGKESLYSVGRSLAVYDPGVGYCQGFSFFTAVLLLHMPVEQAFVVLAQVANNYGVRELVINDFDGLHLRLYQLERLIQDQVPDVAEHFKHLGLRAHMYASQWFLTVFTSKFPLPVVYQFVDLFLAYGMIFILRIALTLIRLSRRTILGLEFEGILRYFTSTLPKQYMSAEASRELFVAIAATKVAPAKLRKYEKEWVATKGGSTTSSIERLQTDNSTLHREVADLRGKVEQLKVENKSLITLFAANKATNSRHIEKLEDQLVNLERERVTLQRSLIDANDEKSLLTDEVAQLKLLLRNMTSTPSDQPTQQPSPS